MTSSVVLVSQKPTEVPNSTGRKLKCPSAGGSINQVWYIHMEKYYAAVPEE